MPNAHDSQSPWPGRIIYVLGPTAAAFGYVFSLFGRLFRMETHAAFLEELGEHVGKAMIAQMPAEAYPRSKSQCDWFYRRSGSIMRSPFMLNSDWFEPEIKQYLAPNFVAEAAKGEVEAWPVGIDVGEAAGHRAVAPGNAL